MKAVKSAMHATGWAGAATLVLVSWCWTVAAEQPLDFKPAAVDAAQYADFMANEALDMPDLAETAESQREMFNRMTPPDFSWLQPMFPPVVPFDAANFNNSFLDGLLGADKNSVTVYPLSLVLDPKTRETIVFNAEGKPLAAIPADKGSKLWPKDADPARVTLLLNLLPTEDVEPYLYVENLLASAAVSRAAKQARSGGPARRSLGAGQFGICHIQTLTNGHMQITVTNGTDVAEIFAYTVLYAASNVVVSNETLTLWTPVSPSLNGLEGAWECQTTNLALTNGVGVWDDSNISSNDRVRFYGVANRVDTDDDGLTDGAELFVHHTEPGVADTDDDGLVDGAEVNDHGTNPLIADTDRDGLSDGWEVQYMAYGLNPLSAPVGDLVGWWRLDEGGGTNAFNSATNAGHGALMNFSGASNGGWAAQGRYGRAVRFDGVDDWIRIPKDYSMLTGGAFTVSAHAYLEGDHPSVWPAVVSDVDANGSGNGYVVGFTQTNTAYAMVNWSGLIQGSQRLTNQWVWLALTFNGTNMMLYANGGLLWPTPLASFIETTNEYFSIGNGQDPSTTEHWKGMIDDVQLHRKALGTSELAALYSGDAWEDPDGDGLVNIMEFQTGSRPDMADTDGDGMNDKDEVDQDFDPTVSNGPAMVWVQFPENGRRIP